MIPEIWSVTDRIFSHFGPFFALLPLPPPPHHPLSNPKNENFEKMKKTLRHHQFTQVYHKWKPYDMIPEISTATDRFFCHPGPLPNSPKKEYIKKKHLEISSFYTSVPKLMIICYTVPEIWRMTNVVVIFHFRLFSTLLPP